MASALLCFSLFLYSERLRAGTRRTLIREMERRTMSAFTWRCQICYRERPDVKISVHKVDIGPKTLPPGTVTRNVKYCNDNPQCEEAAKNWNEEDFRQKARLTV